MGNNDTFNEYVIRVLTKEVVISVFAGSFIEQVVCEKTEKLFKVYNFEPADWKDDPEGQPKPEGLLKLINGDEYDAARKAANAYIKSRMERVGHTGN